MSEFSKRRRRQKHRQKTQAVTEAKTEAVLYVGPTISGIAITGTVYTTIPEAAKAAKADAPMILEPFHSDQRIRRGRENDQRKERIRIQRLRRSAEIQT